MSFGWINGVLWSGIDIEAFPHVNAWHQRVMARPATRAGLDVPTPPRFDNSVYRRKLKEEPEFVESERVFKETLKKAQEQFGYKYASP